MTLCSLTLLYFGIKKLGMADMVRCVLWTTKLPQVILITNDRGCLRMAKEHNLPATSLVDLDKGLVACGDVPWTAPLIKKVCLNLFCLLWYKLMIFSASQMRWKQYQEESPFLLLYAIRAFMTNFNSHYTLLCTSSKQVSFVYLCFSNFSFRTRGEVYMEEKSWRNYCWAFFWSRLGFENRVGTCRYLWPFFNRALAMKSNWPTLQKLSGIFLFLCHLAFISTPSLSMESMPMIPIFLLCPSKKGKESMSFMCKVCALGLWVSWKIMYRDGSLCLTKDLKTLSNKLCKLWKGISKDFHFCNCQFDKILTCWHRPRAKCQLHLLL